MVGIGRDVKMSNDYSSNELIICGLLGDPVEHSISPILFHFLAKSANLQNYLHIKFRIRRNIKNELKRAVDGIKVFGFRGFNITLPYKEEIIKYVDYLDVEARKIGAVNTILNKNRKIYGFNTDGIGAITSIETSSRKIESDDKVVVIGAGGASRAVCTEVYKRTQNLVIINRTLNRLYKVKKQLEKWGGKGVKCLILNKENLKTELNKADFILNTTSVGMYPNVNETLIDKDLLSYLSNQRGGLEGVVCWDAIFNPYKTLFLKEAEKLGATVISGLGMMIHQGIRAFKIWTDKDVNLRIVPKIEKKLIKILETKSKKESK